MFCFQFFYIKNEKNDNDKLYLVLYMKFGIVDIFNECIVSVFGREY